MFLSLVTAIHPLPATELIHIFARSIDREVIIVHLDSYALGAKTRRYDVLAEVPIEKERRQLRRRLQARTGSLPRSPCPGVRSHQRDR